MQPTLSNPSINDYPQIDLHCHRSASAEQLHIINLDIQTPTHAIDNMLGNAMRYASVGIHPWYIARLDILQAIQTLNTIATNPAVVAIGECGLDKAIATPLLLQIELFSRQIKLSERLKKPLIVHCVRAFSELLQLKKQLSPNQPWIIHGFTGKPALAHQLLQHGCYLSFGKPLLDRQPLQNSLAATPIDRLFLETDAATDVTIGEVYTVAAKILHLDPPTLQRQIVANFNRVFTHD